MFLRSVVRSFAHVRGTAILRRSLAAASGGGGPPPPPPPPPPSTALIVDVTAQTFPSLVQQSAVPVILDCHADWCGPCKQLAPLLEAHVAKAAGGLRLAKVDVDVEKQLAQALQVTSLPAVFGVVGGRVVGQFVGMQTPEAVDAFVAQLMAAAAEGGGPGGPGGGGGAPPGANAVQLLAAGDAALAGGDAASARKAFEHALVAAADATPPPMPPPPNPTPPGYMPPPPPPSATVWRAELGTLSRASLARVELSVGEVEAAAAAVAGMRAADKGWADVPQAAQVAAAVDLAAAAAVAGGGGTREELAAAVAAAEAAVAAAAGDGEGGEGGDGGGGGGGGDGDGDGEAAAERVAALSEARHALALSHAAECTDEGAAAAAALWLAVVKQDRGWGEGAAQASLLQLFGALGGAHPVTKKGRARLTNLLFV